MVKIVKMNSIFFQSCILLCLFFILLNANSNGYTDKKNNNNYKRHADKLYGAKVNPTGEPIGGGKGYTKIISKYDFLVRNRDELLDALKKAKKGDVIFISDTSKIDLSKDDKIVIHGGITLASNRGVNDSEGALLFSSDINKLIQSLFLIKGDSVRITGLRIQGPDSTTRFKTFYKKNENNKWVFDSKNYYSFPTSCGIMSGYSYTEIDNCELSGWGHAAIFLVLTKKADTICNNNYIHHNYIHHNQRSGLGYGICLDNAEVLIEGNIFDWDRHGITGTGRPKTAFEARFNIAKHANFDMHGGSDRKDNTSIAGKYIKIHHNDFFLMDNACVQIRGISVLQSEIYNNSFSQTIPEKAVIQSTAKGNLKVYNNKFGDTIK